ncbi:MAG: hypothetical protein K6A38_11155 [Lachnospiraceae bacterium]|nr:hypothetical protein [Lachnospiraceae bacterium]
MSLLHGKVNKETSVALKESLKSGHTIGSVTIAGDALFVKKGLSCFYIKYDEAQKIFRRVRRLHANICCGDGDIEVEYLVIYANDRELMEVTLPGKKAAKMLLEEIKSKAPSLDTKAPEKPESDDENLPDKKDSDEADA